jgi:hypothetical protein
MVELGPAAGAGGRVNLRVFTADVDVEVLEIDLVDLAQTGRLRRRDRLFHADGGQWLFLFAAAIASSVASLLWFVPAASPVNNDQGKGPK